MRSPLVRRPSPAFVLAFVALLVALAGTASGLPGNKIIDGNDLRKNVVRSIHIKNSKVRGADIGAKQVFRADLADNARTMWARVDGSTGAVIDQSGGLSSVRLANGLYRVRFPRSTAGRMLVTESASLDDNAQIDARFLARRCGDGNGDLGTCSPPATNNAAHVLVTADDPGGADDDVSFWIGALP